MLCEVRAARCPVGTLRTGPQLCFQTAWWQAFARSFCTCATNSRCDSSHSSGCSTTRLATIHWRA